MTAIGCRAVMENKGNSHDMEGKIPGQAKVAEFIVSAGVAPKQR
jgi:hypothetical protein